MAAPAGVQLSHLGEQYSQSQYTMAPIPGMDPDAARAYREVTLTPDVTTQNDAYLRLDTYTPDTDVGNIRSEPKPDISLYCRTCCKHVGLRLLQEHRVYHRALEAMAYHGGAVPENINALRERRIALLTKLRSKSRIDGTVDPSKIQKLNEAFELLKAELEDTFDACRRVVEDVNTDVEGLPLSCSTACAPAVAICSHGNHRWKSCMEDTRVFQDYFGNDPDKCFFALYDGHNGRFAAEIAANELHHFLLLEMEKFDPRTKCTCTFNMAENYDLTDYELQEIHSRPASKFTERGIIHEESMNVIHQIIRTCEERLTTLDDSEVEAKAIKREDEQKPVERTKATNEKKSKKRIKDPFAEKMSHAFKKAHKLTDFVLSYGKDELSRVRWSGCSTLACVIQNSPEADVDEVGESGGRAPEEVHIGEDTAADGPNEGDKASLDDPPKQLGVVHLANAGNAHAVLVRANRAYRLTRDHTLKNTKEKSRILRSGGTINEGGTDLRVNGVLSTTRGLGNHGDIRLKRCVITEPSTTSIQIDQYAQFLILATNGVWEVFSEEEAASILLEMLPSNHVPPPSSISTSLNYIYDNRGSDSNMDSEYSQTSCHVSEMEELKRADRFQSESYEQVFGNLGSKKAKKISEAKSAFEQHSLMPKETFSDGANREKSAGTKDGSFAGDMQPEIGSQIESEVGESGNEADVETDFVTISTRSRLSAQHLNSEHSQRELAKAMSERLVQAALLAGSKDNITVMVVLLPGCETY